MPVTPRRIGDLTPGGGSPVAVLEPMAIPHPDELRIDPASVIDLDRHGEDVPPSAVSQSSLAPTPIACDNQAVVAASGNPETSQRTRHLDMRYFKVRDYIRQQQLRVRHIRTDVNVADFFTKQLPKKDYQRYRDYLGMEDHSV